MTRLFLKFFLKNLMSNYYGLLRTLKEIEGKWKKMISITDCHGLE